MRRRFWITPLLTLGLLSTVLTAEEVDVETAKQSAAEAKLAIEAAQKKLDEAEAIIKKSEAAIAEEKSDDAVYSTKTELSYSSTKGNTDTKRFAFDFHGERKRKKHTIKLDITALQSSSDGDEDSNKWNVLAQYDRDLTKKLFFNYLISYGEDKFSGFDYQFNTGPGFGYKALDSDAHKLDLRANALYSKDELEDEGSNEYVSWVVGFKYKWAVLENLDFLQDAYFKSQVDHFDNYFVYSKTAIESKINSMFSLGMSYKIDYKNVPAEDRKRTDRVFLASLIINY